MQETKPSVIVDAYLDAVRDRDFERARSFLADRGFLAISPIARFDDADAFMADVERASAILARIATRLRFCNENDVCHVLDVTVSLGAYSTVTVVSLLRVRDGYIARVESIFDAREYQRMFGDLEPLS